MTSIWLVGMMGAGKSAVAEAVAARLGMEAVDTDSLVAARMGCSVAELWGSVGEEAFRDMEAVQIKELAGASDRVIATGGGAVLRTDNVRAMKASGLVVWLDAPIALLAERIGDGSGRPLLAAGSPHRTLAALAAQREEVYAAAADVRIDTAGLDVDEVSELVVGVWTAS